MASAEIAQQLGQGTPADPEHAAARGPAGKPLGSGSAAEQQAHEMKVQGQPRQKFAAFSTVSATGGPHMPPSPKEQHQQMKANELNSLPKLSNNHDAYCAAKCQLAVQCLHNTSLQQNTKVDGVQPSSMLIVVPRNFRCKQGAKLTDDMLVGKKIGEGMQAIVWEITDKEGKTDADHVIKYKKSGIGNVISSFQREWEVGRRVSSLLEPDARLPGFMGVGAGVCTEAGKFEGMILERLTGKDCGKICRRAAFHDIHFVREMLFYTFSALDTAQKQIGFHHADCRLCNVMDLGPDPEDVQLLQNAQSLDVNVNAGAIGPEHADSRMQASTLQTAPSAHGVPVLVKASNGPVARAHNAGREMARQNSRSLEMERAPPPPEGGQQAQESAKASASDPLSSTGVSPFAGQPRASTDEDRPAPAPYVVPSRAPSIPMRDDTAGMRLPHRYTLIDYGLADFEARYAAGMIGKVAQYGTERAPKQEGFRQRRARDGKKGFMPMPLGRSTLHLIPKVSVVERSWRFLWRRKGDVYHLLFDMCRFLDGRVWPDSDRADVLLFMALVKHVTGVPLRAWYARLEGENQDSQVLRLKDQHVRCGMFERSDGTFHILRVRAIRFRAWLNPHNPGLTAAEVLTSPFFKPCYEGNWAASVRCGPEKVADYGAEPASEAQTGNSAE